MIADGFSCRTQIEQAGTGRRAMHLAEALRLASSGVDDEHDAAPRPRAARTGGRLIVGGFGGLAFDAAVAATRRAGRRERPRRARPA